MFQAGAEIVQSYFPLNLHYSERQQRTRDLYGFECGCWRCQHDAARAAAKAGDTGAQAMEQSESDGEGGVEEEAHSEWETDEDEEDGGVDGQLAVFMLKHLCPNEECSGTLGPPNPTADHMECNFCGKARTDAQFFQMLEDL